MAREGAATVRSERPALLQRWLSGHARGLRTALNGLRSQGAGGLLTALAIGITLALPAGLQVLLANLGTVTRAWESGIQISLFLKDEVTPQQGRALAERLQTGDAVTSAVYRSKEESAAEFRALSGFGEALDLLSENPLPAVILLTPAPGLDSAALGELVGTLGAQPEVEQARLDQQWLDRLAALLALIGRGVWLLAGGLALAVVVIVGNTIRLEIARRREEIRVMHWLGAPPAFIRRPFLYTGLAHGLLGGLLALLAVQLMVWALTGPAGSLAALYGSGFRLRGLGLETAAAVLLAGLVLGGFGAAWAVHRHLNPGSGEAGNSSGL